MPDVVEPDGIIPPIPGVEGEVWALLKREATLVPLWPTPPNAKSSMHLNSRKIDIVCQSLGNKVSPNFWMDE